MFSDSFRIFSLITFSTVLWATSPPSLTAEDQPSPTSLTVLVMDPLSAPLACDCVQGYAQRKYEHLGEYLQRALRKPVKIVWSETIERSDKENGVAQLIIGKHSVVQHEAKALKQKFRPIAQLTGLDGSVNQTGLIVVRSTDKAQQAQDLNGYRILFGPEDCQEKHAAIKTLLTKANVDLPKTLEVSPACSEAAATLMETPPNSKAAAVISSYAKPLLAGCGTIRKGDLRVVAESNPVPFITAFASSKLPKTDLQQLRDALLDVELEPSLMIALETSEGFHKWTKPDRRKDKSSDNKGKSVTPKADVVSKKK